MKGGRFTAQRALERCLRDATQVVRALVVAEAGEIGVEVGVGAADQEGEGEVGGHRAEAPPCLAPSQADEEEEEGLRVMTGAGGVVGAGMLLAMSSM